MRVRSASGISNGCSRLLRGLLSVSLTVGLLPAMPLPAWAADEVVQVDGVYYTLHADGTAAVGRQSRAGQSLAVDDGFSGEVSVQASVKDPGGVDYVVTSVNPYAFGDGSGTVSSAVNAITLPNTLQQIGAYAFAGCRSLTQVRITEGSSLTSIGAYAFAQCTSLTAVYVPVSVESVGSYCFYGCTSLAQVEFEDLDAPTPVLRMDSSAFATSALGTALVTITLPARLESIPTKLFQNQVNLKRVELRGTSLTTIGSFAFDCCRSLEEIRIPELTTEGTTPIGTRAFRGCDALKTVVFTADVNYSVDATQFASSEMLTTYAAIPLDIDAIVYYGSTTSVLFPDKGNHYYRVGFYASEQAYQAGELPLSYACVRDDVALSAISSGMAQEDEKGKVLFEGEVPELSEQGSWYFPGYSKDDTLSGGAVAYMVDDFNLACAEFTGTFDYPYRASPVTLDLAVRTVGGVRLSEGVDYLLSVTDASGAPVAATAVTNPGTYQATATAASGSRYAGSLNCTFTVTNQPVAITRFSGGGTYGVNLSVNQAIANAKGQVDTVILVSAKDKSHTLAVAGLAGAFQAAVVQTAPTRLSAEVKTSLRALSPRSVIIVGSKKTVSNTVRNQVARSLPASTQISRLYGATKYATALALYQRTKSTGVWKGSKTCVIVSGKKAYAYGALAISAFAYASASPVFVTQAKKGLSKEARKAIKAGGFTNVLLVGSKKAVPTKVKKQLGSKCTYKRLKGANACKLSKAVTAYAVKKGVLQYDNAVVSSSKTQAVALSAGVLAGVSQSALLFVDQGSSGVSANLKLLGARRYSLSQVYLVGGTGSVSKATQAKLAAALKK